MKGFVSKWSRIYRIRKLFNSKYKNRKVSMSVFNLISARLKKIIRKFGRKARKVIIELCNTKEYHRFGS